MGGMALGLCRESWKEKGDFSGYLCTGAISGGDSFMDVLIPKMELEHTYFISLPQIDPLSLFPDPFVDQLPR